MSDRPTALGPVIRGAFTFFGGRLRCPDAPAAAASELARRRARASRAKSVGFLGADTESLNGNRLRVKLNHAEAVLHRPHHGHTLDRTGVRALRGFLAASRNTPSQYDEAHGK